MRIPEFALGADNLYRTKNNIVKQVLSISMFEENNNNIVSEDTFYKRTKKRDKEYASLFEGGGVMCQRLQTTSLHYDHKKICEITIY